jgi:hypothetical protein
MTSKVPMKLVVKARLLDPYAEPLLAVVTLDAEALAKIDAHRALFERSLADAPALSSMSFGSGAATYYPEDDVRERLTPDELARLEEDDVVELAGDFSPGLEEARTECEQVTLLTHGLVWEAGFRHTDDWVETEIVLFERRAGTSLGPEGAHGADGWRQPPRRAGDDGFFPLAPA